MIAPKGFQPLRFAVYKQWSVTVLLLIIMAITRSGYLAYLFDASWAIFFLIGFYLRSIIGLPLIIISAAIIDFAVIAARGGHQDYYLTPSYLFIIPAYAALWYAGRYFANKYSESIKGLITFIVIAVTGIIICDLISSGGFYWMSTDFIELSKQEFLSRTVEFMPVSLKTTMLYLCIAAVTHLAILKINKINSNRNTHSTSLVSGLKIINSSRA